MSLHTECKTRKYYPNHKNHTSPYKSRERSKKGGTTPSREASVHCPLRPAAVTGEDPVDPANVSPECSSDRQFHQIRPGFLASSVTTGPVVCFNLSLGCHYFKSREQIILQTSDSLVILITAKISHLFCVMELTWVLHTKVSIFVVLQCPSVP